MPSQYYSNKSRMQQIGRGKKPRNIDAEEIDLASKVIAGAPENWRIELDKDIPEFKKYPQYIVTIPFIRPCNSHVGKKVRGNVKAIVPQSAIVAGKGLKLIIGALKRELDGPTFATVLQQVEDTAKRKKKVAANKVIKKAFPPVAPANASNVIVGAPDNWKIELAEDLPDFENYAQYRVTIPFIRPGSAGTGELVKSQVKTVVPQSAVENGEGLSYIYSVLESELDDSTLTIIRKQIKDAAKRNKEVIPTKASASAFEAERRLWLHLKKKFESQKDSRHKLDAFAMTLQQIEDAAKRRNTFANNMVTEYTTGGENNTIRGENPNIQFMFNRNESPSGDNSERASSDTSTESSSYEVLCFSPPARKPKKRQIKKSQSHMLGRYYQDNCFAKNRLRGTRKRGPGKQFNVERKYIHHTIPGDESHVSSTEPSSESYSSGEVEYVAPSAVKSKRRIRGKLNPPTYYKKETPRKFQNNRPRLL